MSYVDHDFEPILRKLNLLSITTLLRYYDLLFCFKLKHNIIPCHNLVNALTIRPTVYNIRNQRIIVTSL